MTGNSGNTVIVHKDPFAYISHPSITQTPNGDWLAAFNHSVRRNPKMHPPSDPLFRTLVSRSRDRGATWEPPVFAPNFDTYGTECPGIACAPDGAVLLSVFRFAWYPIGLARKLHARGTPLALWLPDAEGGWTETFQDADWDRVRAPWARGRHGVYVHRSTDNGESFDETVALDTAPYAYGYSRTGIVTLSDGRLAYVLGEKCKSARIYLLTSDDNGKTWSRPTGVVEHPAYPFSEPDLVEVAPGEWLCILRESKTATHSLQVCRTTDAGRTWSTPEKTPMFGKPGHVIQLADGRLLCAYGRRQRPFGVRACLSEDGGRTWDIDNERVVRDDFPNGDLGYPTTIEYAPGKLFCCYYGQTPDGVTCVQGTWLEVD